MSALQVFLFVFIFNICWQNSKATKIVSDPTPFEIKFEGNVHVSDVHHHNSTIICTVHSYFLMKDLSQYNPTTLDGDLCTHLLFLGFEINDNTGNLERERQSIDPWEWFLPKLHDLRVKYPWLQLLIQISDAEGYRTIIEDNALTATFYKSVLQELSASKLNGVFLNVGVVKDMSFQIVEEFVCGLSKVVRRGGFILGFVHPTVPAGMLGYNYSSFVHCVDLFHLDTFFMSNEKVYVHTFQAKLEGIAFGVVPTVEWLLKEGLLAKKIAVQITIRSPVYTLQGVNLTLPDCCGIEAPATLGMTVGDMTKQFLTQSEICEASHVDGPWFRYRTNGSDMYMTNTRLWISCSDWKSLKAKVKFISQYGTGVLIHSPFEDNNNDKCSSTNVSFPLLRSINYWLSNNGSTKIRRKNIKKFVPPPLPKTVAECDLLKQLKKAGVKSKDYTLYICLAKEESNYTVNQRLKRSKVKDKNGCPSAKYGIFGLFSPICGITPEGNCGLTFCSISCNDAADSNLTNDIQCIQELRSGRSSVLPHSMQFCIQNYGKKNSVEYDLDFCDFCDAAVPLDAATCESCSYVIVGLVLICLGTVCIIATTVFHWWHRIQKLAYDIMGKTFSPDEIKEFELGIISGGLTGAELPYDKRIEVPFQSFSIYTGDILGKGAFGIVYKALAMNRIVAAKTVKPYAEKEYIVTLLSEIKIMHFLGQHENIIEFIGAYTKELGNGIVHIFTEFCPLGSLQGYLRAHKDHEGEDVGKLTRKTLLTWCHQIANGMAYLSTKNVVHGDLSTKNILLNSEAQAKVSDFGLSRKLYSYTFYVKTKQEPLPWRWMSIEALRDLHFSTQSDVWAFGITMWEIFTLGEVPYPGINFSPSFLNLLIAEGVRPRQPIALDDFAFQNILEPTWEANPELRPTFPMLRHLLLTLLGQEGSKDYTVLMEKEEEVKKESNN